MSSLIDEGDPNELLKEDTEFNLEDYLKFKAQLELEDKAANDDSQVSNSSEEEEDMWGSDDSDDDEEVEETYKR